MQNPIDEQIQQHARNWRTKALFPQEKVSRWMTKRKEGEILPDVMILSTTYAIDLIENAEKIYARLDELEDKMTVKVGENKGHLDFRKLNEKEKNEYFELLDIAPTPESLVGSYAKFWVDTKDSVAPSINGDRAKDAVQIECASEGASIRQKKRGLIDRIFRRKPQTEVVPSLNTIEGANQP